MGLFSRWSINTAFIFATIIYIVGLTTNVMEVDSAQYASLSEEMNRTGSYLEIYHNGFDYLDKPPVLFWLNALMFKIFGVHNWSFKLSSFLFSILGVIATYKLGYLLYNKRIGFIAAIMLSTCQAYFLYNADVRTDAILTASVIFSVWQIISYLYTHKWKYLIFGFMGIGIAMMAKGPIGLMVPILAIGSYLIGRQQFKDIFKWQWLIGFVVTGIVIFPMCYGLYTQFDLHPEKQLKFISDHGVEMRKGVSGLRFYFWEQSFGRITGENVWKDSSGPFFFVGIFGYSFLPWAGLAILAIFWRVINTVNDFFTSVKKQEWLTLGGFLLPFIAFSMSNYKLDHYIYVTYPFAAIITSEYVVRIVFEKPKWWVNVLSILQALVIFGSIAVSTAILVYVFPTSNIIIWLGFVTLIVVAVYHYFSKHTINKIVMASVFASLAANWVLSLKFFPELTSNYQSGQKMVSYIEENNIPKENVHIEYHRFQFQYNFYAQYQLKLFTAEKVNEYGDLHPNHFYYVREIDLKTFDEQNIKYEIKQEFETYHITMLTPEFLNPKTRPRVLNKEYLIQVI